MIKYCGWGYIQAKNQIWIASWDLMHFAKLPDTWLIWTKKHIYIASDLFFWNMKSMVQAFHLTDIYKQQINKEWCICFMFCCIMMTSSKWKHFPHYRPFVQGIHWAPVNSRHKGQWWGALMFSLICTWINSWVNNHEAGDFRHHCPIMTSL